MLAALDAIAGARSVAQLEDLLPMATLRLSPAEAARLDAASSDAV